MMLRTNCILLIFSVSEMLSLHPEQREVSNMLHVCLWSVEKLCPAINIFFPDIIKEQNRELRGTQRAISRDRAALEKQEKQLVSMTENFILIFKAHT